MTTIAYRAGRIAADTGLSMGASRTSTHLVKIARNVRGDLAGVCGGAAFGAKFLAWFITGEVDERPYFEKEQDQAMVCRISGTIEIHEGGGVYTVDEPYFAIGGGKPEALGAMFAGADAELAVKAAMAHDHGTFGTVMCRRHVEQYPITTRKRPNGEEPDQPLHERPKLGVRLSEAWCDEGGGC